MTKNYGSAMAIVAVVAAMIVAMKGTYAQTPTTVMGVACAKIFELGIDKQTNLRAAAVRVGCGLEAGGTSWPGGGSQAQASPAFTAAAPANVNTITGTETYPHVTQSESMVWSSDGNTVVVNYNDSTCAGNCATARLDDGDELVVGYSGVSYSTNGGASFTRILPSPFNTGHGNNYGDPIVVYNKKLAKWFAGDLADGCGGQGIGLWTSTDGITWSTGACAHSGGSDDRESMWVDNTPSSPYYGRMYISWNDFNVGSGALYVTHSDDGTTWTPVQVKSSFIRDVQITGGEEGHVWLAAMDEGGGGLNNRTNYMYRSTDGGATFGSAITVGAPFAAPGDSLCSSNSYFAQVNPIWRHMGWGQPARHAGVTHYVYAGKGGNSGDTGDIFYTRSTDNGVTWSTPIVLNTDQASGANKTQWMPSLSVTDSGDLLAYWYDRRNTTDGSNYEIWSRRSADNGATWSPDQPVSDVLIPQPLQPDPNVVSCYAGDYNYSSAFGNTHYATWTDGRVQVSGNNQQDVFFAKITGSALASKTAIPDFDGDGKSDILWRNSDGTVAEWLMNGGSFTGVTLAAGVDNAWHIVGTRDFNGDGKSDILWRHNDGSVAIWLTNGSSFSGVLVAAGVSNAWHIDAVGDFNGDGKSDILWRADDGSVAMWLMNGGTIASGVTVASGVPAAWHITAVADFNGDGKSDILWRNTDGTVAIWLMNGGTITSGITVAAGVSNAWQIAGVGDFNGDGNADILWRYTDGTVAMWLMNNGTITSGVTVSAGVSNAWQIVGVGDFNGDGKSDILWRYTDGSVAMWLMNGGSIASGISVASGVPTSWTTYQFPIVSAGGP